MRDKILINFVAGSHGYFLQFLLESAFSSSSLKNADVLTVNGTYHKRPDNQGYNIFKSGHYGSNPICKSDIISTSKFISITNNSLMEKSLICQYWRRRGDAFLFLPDELVHKSVTEIMLEWYVRQASRLREKHYGGLIRNQTRELSKLFDIAFPENNQFTSEMKIIKFWCNSINYTINSIHSDKEWLIEIKKDYQVIEFEMAWLYNKVKCIQAIDEIGKLYGLTRIATNQQLITILDEFIQKLGDLPNVTLTQSKFDALILNSDITLNDLHIKDKILLFIMCVLNFNINSDSFTDQLQEFPSTTSDLLTEINKFLK